MQIKEFFDKLLEETTKLDFPFLSSRQKREEIIENEKIEIDASIKSNVINIPGRKIDDDILNELWDEAKQITEPDFVKLPEKVKINGFYYQQLMHNYVSLISHYIEGE